MKYECSNLVKYNASVLICVKENAFEKIECNIQEFM